MFFFQILFIEFIFQGDQFEGGDLYFGTMAKANRTVFSNFTCKKKKSKIKINSNK